MMKETNLVKWAGLWLLVAVLTMPRMGMAEQSDITVDVVSKGAFVIFLLKNYEDNDFHCASIRVEATMKDKDERVALRTIMARNLSLPAGSLEIKVEAGKEVIGALRNEMNQPRIVTLHKLNYRCDPIKIVYVTADKKVFRDRLTGGGLGPEMVSIPAGSFRMLNSPAESKLSEIFSYIDTIEGSESIRDFIEHSDELPMTVHSIFVVEFAIGRYEVTVGEFRQFVRATGYETEIGTSCFSWTSSLSGGNWHNPKFSQSDNHPVVCVSWNDAIAYTKWLSQQTGQQYCLPTEAQWEYAARAGTETHFWWGNKASHEYANYGTDGGFAGFAKGKDRWKYTSPVGSFEPNHFGLYDPVGNVAEWTCSEYEYELKGKEKQCSNKNNVNERPRVALRGGSFNSDPGRASVDYRSDQYPNMGSNFIGFRLARSSSSCTN